MLTGLLFSLTVCLAGVGVLRLLRLSGTFLLVGLAPAVGLAVLSVLTSWSSVLGLPPLVRVAALVLAATFGILVLARTSWAARGSIALGVVVPRLVLLTMALVIPAIVLGFAYRDVAVPVSSHDGAHHLELIEMVRRGETWDGWYPASFHGIVAAFLELTPWLEPSQGAFEISLGLTLLGQLAAFGFAYAVWRNPSIAASGALLLGLTLQYPYRLHLFSLWPMAGGIVLVLGLWAVAVRYLEEPRRRWLVLGALLAGAIVLMHALEVYTAVVGLALILLSRRRNVRWGVLARDLGVTTLMALLVALPFVPTVLGFAASGGAVAVGSAAATSQVSRMGLTGDLGLLWLDSVGALAIDFPVRAAVVLAGVWFALRTHTARVLIPLSVAFVALPVAFTYVELPVLQRLFSLTFPWSHGYRLLMVAALVANVLAGAGLMYLIQRIRHLRSERQRRLTTRVLVLAGSLSALAYIGLLPYRLASESAGYVTFATDDAAALSWLATHAQAGDVVANDGAADAGIWAPYKASTPILMPRALAVDEAVTRQMVRDNIAQLDRLPSLQAAACDLGVRYVYRGAAGTAYEPRRFPSVHALRESSALHEVFNQGDAAVFRLDCQG